jgi:hypothetical protein
MIAGVTVINLLLIAFLSIFAIHGDGTLGGLPVVLGLGVLWALSFALRACQHFRRNEYQRSVFVVSMTIPCGFALIIVASSAYFLFAALWRNGT